MDNHIRYCSTHTTEQMALTIDGFVCDICSPEPPKLPNGRNDADGFVLCPTCGKKAIGANRPVDLWMARCANDHQWYPEGGWRVGDKTNNITYVIVAGSVNGYSVCWEQWKSK